MRSNWDVHTSDGIIGMPITVTKPKFLKSNVKFKFLSWNNLFHSEHPIHRNQLPLLF